ncbi:MAG: ISL3 family transposase [Chthoniobacteraceae bacterium]
MTSLLNRIGISGYQVLYTEATLPLKIHVKPEAQTCSCPCCGGGRLHSKGRYQKQVRHLDRFGEPTALVVHTRRLRCLDCRHSFVPPLPGLLPGRHSSEPFRENAYCQHHNGICVSTLARILHIGSATIERIYHQFTERKAKERSSLRCPMVLGIDEHTLHKGQRFATTFVDLKNHRVFNVVPGRSPRELAPLVARLQGREHVRVVCIDLSSPYRALIRKWFPNARIVADRFHVIRVVIHHFMALARAIAPDLKNNIASLAVLRKAPHKLTPVQTLRLERLFATYPALQPLHTEMHRLRALLNQKHRRRRECRPLAQELLGFIDRLTTSRFEPLITLANTLRSWAEPIACMWRFTRNNGITEGFHRKMKLIQRRAYGFRNFRNYQIRVLAACG